MENLKYRPLRMKDEKESKGIAKPAGKLHAETAELVMEIMNAATSFHKLHLSVTGEGSYAQHMALNDLYEALPIISLYVFAGYRLLPALQQIYAAFTTLTYAGPTIDKLAEDFKNLKKFKPLPKPDKFKQEYIIPIFYKIGR